MLRVSRWKLLAAVVLPVVIGLSSCTPEQVDQFQRDTGITFTPEERAGLLKAPVGFVHSDADVQRWHDVAIEAGWPEAKWRSWVIQTLSEALFGP